MARTSTAWLTRLTSKGPVLLDGGTGSLLMARNGGASGYSMLLNLSAPESVESVHREFLAAGAQVIVANSFCASRAYLNPLGLAGRVAEINKAAVMLARGAAGSAQSGTVLVAGSIAPLPRGLTHDEQRQIFGEQVEALVESGVDLILCETFLDAIQGLTAVRVARDISAGRGMNLPVVLSMVPRVDAGSRIGWEQIGEALADGWLDLFGLNCGEGLLQTELCLAQLETRVFGPFWLKPSAGTAGSLVDAVEFGGVVGRLLKYFPIAAVGGCCGAGRDHVEAVSQALSANRDESNCTDFEGFPS